MSTDTYPPEQPLVSVVVPTYNGADFLAAALTSVLAQTYTSVECIVIDDGSTDDTPSIIESFGPRLRSLRQTNQGFARTRNHGAALARGELLSFLDDDDWWEKTKLERQVSLLARRPELALVYTAVEVVDGDDRPLGTIAAPAPEQALRNTLLMQWPHLALEQGALIRRDAFLALGGFDEQLSTSIGCDLACRLALTYPVGGIDEPLAAYRQHANQMHHDLSRLEHDMQVVYAKVLALEPRCRPLVRRARYNLHVCLARWYWRQSRRRAAAGRHAARAVVACPAHAAAAVSRRGKTTQPALQL